MTAKWFCKIDDREFGPLLGSQLQRLATRGQLRADSLIRRENSDQWVSAAEVPEFQSQFGAKTASPPKGTQKPVARPLPVAAAAPPPAPPASPPAAPVASGPSIQIETQPKPPISQGVAPTAHSTGSEGTSRVMLAGLIGLGCVVVVLLVAIAFLLTRDDQREGELTADAEQAATDTGDKDEQELNPVAADEPSAASAPPKPAKKTPAVKNWSSVSSKLIIRKKETRTPICRVGINSVWVSDDPSGGTVANDPAIASTGGNSNKKDVGDDDVLDISALGVSKKKRTDVTGRIIKPEPESSTDKAASEDQAVAAATTKDPGTFRYVFVQLNLANASADEPLDYLGWNGNGETVQSKDAKLFDQDGNECLFVSRIESPRDDRQTETTIAPGETLLDVLVFELPADGFEHLRLVLPQEAIGLSGTLGYEIGKSDLAFGSTVTSATPAGTLQDAAANDKKPPTKADLEREIQRLREDLTKPKDEQPDNVEAPKKRDAKEEFQDLKRLIEAERNRE